jgi:sugar phosphate isomerase/epimerase
MKLGFVTEFDEETVAFAAAHGFDCLELQAGPLSALRAIGQRGGLADVRRACERHDVRISSLCLAVNLLDPGAAGAQAREHYDWLLRACDELGADTIATCTGQNPAVSLEENIAALADAWTPIVECAAAQNVSIVFENCPHGYPAGMNLAVSPPFWREIFRVLPAPNVGLEYDPSHLVYQFVDYLAPVTEFGSRIIRFHAKDTEINRAEMAGVGTLGRDWWRFRLPGGGEVNWQALFLKLREIQYAGDILIEHEDPVFRGPRLHEGLLIAQKYLRQFMD